MSKYDSQDSERNNDGSFPETLWSVVSAAGKAGASRSDAALNRLCTQYWYPLYCYIRRRGYSPDDAKDLVQGFFAKLLEREFFSAADRTKGKLRGFLLSSLKFYMLDERKRIAAEKRGGKVVFVQIDDTEANSRYLADPGNTGSPDAVFEHQWATTILQRAAEKLGEAWKIGGKRKPEVFEALRVYLLSPMNADATREIAARFQMTESNVKVSLLRLRDNYTTELHKEIADTVTSEAEIEEELAALRAAIG